MNRPPTLTAIVVVAVGGAIGASVRWLIAQGLPDAGDGFPWAIFAVNVSGSLLLALLPSVAAVRHRALLPLFLGTGVLGGYTTLSTYSEQARHLLDVGRPALAAAYLLGTLAACLVAVALADRFSSRAERAEFEAEEGDL